VEFRDISNEDLSLYERLLCDPNMMTELGGPLPRKGLPEKLRQVVASVEAGETCYFKIIPDEDAGAAAGTVCFGNIPGRETASTRSGGWSFLSIKAEDWEARRCAPSSARLDRRGDGT
jgi:RimJ/RimL family protein N-acetyltransferase